MSATWVRTIRTLWTRRNRVLFFYLVLISTVVLLVGYVISVRTKKEHVPAEQKIETLYADFLAALFAEDIPAALTFIHPDAQEEYGAIFTNAFQKGDLRALHELLRPIEKVSVFSDHATYRISTKEQNTLYAHYISFSLWDNMWRLYAL